MFEPTTKPVRIQRKRTKGWKVPENAIYVGRPTKWGNPFVCYQDGHTGYDRHSTAPEIAVASFRSLLTKQESWSSIPPSKWPRGKIPAQWTTVGEVKEELRGKDLVCWCPLVDKDGNPVPCHADILLEIANA